MGGDFPPGGNTPGGFCSGNYAVHATGFNNLSYLTKVDIHILKDWVTIDKSTICHKLTKKPQSYWTMGMFLLYRIIMANVMKDSSMT